MLLGLFDPEDGTIYLSETFGFQRATQRYIPEDSTLHKNRCAQILHVYFITVKRKKVKLSVCLTN
jgi:hypothetical protein